MSTSRVWAVCSRSGRRSWVSGVFVDENEAGQFLVEARNNTAAFHEIVPIEAQSLPLTIVERDGGFQWLEGKLSTAGREMAVREGEDVTFYEVRSTWRPTPAGRDDMGALPHWHHSKEVG